MDKKKVVDIDKYVRIFFTVISAVSTLIIINDIVALINQPSKEERLIFAAGLGDAEEVEELLSMGVDPNISDPSGLTVLMLAVIFNNVTIVNDLLKAGANPNSQMPTGETALIFAITNCNKRIIAKLIKYGADLNLSEFSENGTPLMYAVYQGDESLVELLIDGGADISAETSHGLTAYNLAERFGFFKIAEKLKFQCP